MAQKQILEVVTAGQDATQEILRMRLCMRKIKEVLDREAIRASQANSSLSEAERDCLNIARSALK